MHLCRLAPRDRWVPSTPHNLFSRAVSYSRALATLSNSPCKCAEHIPSAYRGQLRLSRPVELGSVPNQLQTLLVDRAHTQNSFLGGTFKLAVSQSPCDWLPDGVLGLPVIKAPKFLSVKYTPADRQALFSE